MDAPRITATANAFVGRTLRGKYRIVRRLGEGGYGMVFEAEHLLLRRPVAIKVLHPDLAADAKFAERFRREALAASQIGHPNIVEVHDLDRTDDGVEFMVLELLHGEDLGTRVGSHRRMELREAIAIFRQIASALGAAHAAGIVHRDLKPANVLLCATPEGRNHVKIVDFGIAKLDGSLLDQQGTITQTGTLLGTPYYMSPEQIRSERSLDHRADLYAFGVMLYEALAGMPPYDGPNLPALVGRILYEDHEPLANVRPDLPRGLTDLVTRLLAREAEDRPSHMDFVVATLDAIEAASPTTANDGHHPHDEATLVMPKDAALPPSDAEATLVEGPSVRNLVDAGATFVVPASEPASVPVAPSPRPAPRDDAPVRAAELPVAMTPPPPRSAAFVVATVIAVVAVGLLSYFVVLHL